MTWNCIFKFITSTNVLECMTYSALMVRWRSYPREDSCSISTDKVEVQPAIDLDEYNGLWPAHGGGKPHRFQPRWGHIPILALSIWGHWLGAS